MFAILHDEDDCFYDFDELGRRPVILKRGGEIRWRRRKPGEKPGEFHYPKGIELGWVKDIGNKTRCVRCFDLAAMIGWSGAAERPSRAANVREFRFRARPDAPAVFPQLNLGVVEQSKPIATTFMRPCTSRRASIGRRRTGPKPLLIQKMFHCRIRRTNQAATF